MRLIDLIVNLAITGPRPLTQEKQRFLAALGEELDAAKDVAQMRHIMEREGLLEAWMCEAAVALLDEAFQIDRTATLH